MEKILPQKGELERPFAVVWRGDYNTCPAALGHGQGGVGLGRCWMEVLLCALTSEFNEITGICGLGD